jgi:SAM-dependent methyltransferase
MEVAELRSALQRIGDSTLSDTVLGALPRRKAEELEFHDLHRQQTGPAATEPHDVTRARNLYRTTEASVQFVRDWLQSRVRGKVFLDYACGDGACAIDAARHGSELSIGLDISDVSIRNARRAATAAGVADRCVFIQGDCENTGLPAESVDVVLCSGMLHHLDLSFAFPELRRILNKRGVILAVEALNYNPLIRLYRRLTPQLRTPWEKRHILSLADVRFASRFFDVTDIRYWHLLTPLATFFAPAQGLFDAVDRVLLNVPVLQLMSWQFTFELHKREDL